MPRPSFLDKFVSPSQRPEQRGELHQVCQNIEAVLNTKEGYGYFVEGFGLGRYTEKFGTRDLMKTLTEEMLHSVEQHEPRLKEAQLELRGQDSGLWLHFVLTGSVMGSACTLRILFHTISGQVRVEADEDA
ncbi:type VI secretion system protein [Stigmatella aurantiaca]|uniref:Type VI secretion system protein n=1 Tax=Stigmatella aurantiaca TaxID=41 RepID=A0A1H7TY52_STIAU|nr:GPW/gp25 family protein [Stigmatella aurantiaca]SEL89356.1 type VI secretion system protein [Stigmatella aurantiaca]